MQTSEPSKQLSINLTSSQQAFPVKTSAKQENKEVYKAREVGSSTKSCVWLGRLDLSSSCLKMLHFCTQCKTGKHSKKSSTKLPRQGMAWNGHVYQLKIWEPPIKENVHGLLPTPTHSDWKGRSGINHIARHGPKRLADVLTPPGGGIYVNPQFVEMMMGFPQGWTDTKHLETQ